MSASGRKAVRNKTGPLDTCYTQREDQIEIGIDEAGKGPMFGRVYAAAVCLPKDPASFDHTAMKDSKRFHSKQLITETAEYIRGNAIAWSVQYEEPDIIDQINIRQATFRAMHRAVKSVLQEVLPTPPTSDEILLLVDGNDFKPYLVINPTIGLNPVEHVCIEGGDNKYTSIAAGSILAKVDRDAYITDIAGRHPLLDEWYGILGNKGYGTVRHMEGIRQHGRSPWHRKSYGLCQTVSLNPSFTVE